MEPTPTHPKKDTTPKDDMDDFFAEILTKRNQSIFLFYGLIHICFSEQLLHPRSIVGFGDPSLLQIVHVVRMFNVPLKAWSFFR